jgi:hypothetical protein
VGEVKKKRYVYYHCTGNRGKCPEPYAREEALTSQFARVLQDLVIPQDVLTWLQEEIVASDRSESAAREQVMARCEEDIRRLEARIETMYLDKLEGRISATFFNEKAAKWRAQQQQLLRKIDELRSATAAPLEAAIDLMALTSRSCELFLAQCHEEQRRLLTMLVDRAAWRERTLEVVLSEPFEQLRRSNQLSRKKHRENEGSGRDLGPWLPRQDSKGRAYGQQAEARPVGCRGAAARGLTAYLTGLERL